MNSTSQPVRCSRVGHYHADCPVISEASEAPFNTPLGWRTIHLRYDAQSHRACTMGWVTYHFNLWEIFGFSSIYKSSFLFKSTAQAQYGLTGSPKMAELHHSGDKKPPNRFCSISEIGHYTLCRSPNWCFYIGLRYCRNNCRILIDDASLLSLNSPSSKPIKNIKRRDNFINQKHADFGVFR